MDPRDPSISLAESFDRQIRVLVVDDEEPILRALKRELRGQDYGVEVVNNAQDALELVQKEPFALIISDNRMPGMTGIELLERVKAVAPDTVRILLTGYTDLESAVAAINRGEVHRLITKPWDKAQLLAHIAEGLEKYRLKQINRSLAEALRARNELLTRTSQELVALALKDPMTGLYNHGAFQHQLDRQIKVHHRDGQPFCLALGDIDDFKRINDTFGHPAGDQVIKTVGTVFLTSLRDEVDSAFRYGGEEFALLLRNTDQTGASVVMERLLKTISATRMGNGGDPIAVTMSFGVGTYTTDLDRDGFVSRVDSALYRAKNEGKNRFIQISPDAANPAGPPAD
jgi:diguanylate cyclase (GGDEF)-like protein